MVESRKLKVMSSANEFQLYDFMTLDLKEWQKQY